MPFKYASPLARLRANSDLVGQCWLWTGRVLKNKRPVIGVRVKGKGKAMLVTTYIILFVHKQHKRKHHIGRHSCHNFMCVNPDHVSRSTQSKNVQDAVRRGTHVCGYKLHQQEQRNKRHIRSILKGD